jgi:hypothetical protein
MTLGSDVLVTDKALLPLVEGLKPGAMTCIRMAISLLAFGGMVISKTVCNL